MSPEPVRLTIDGREVAVPPTTTIYDAASQVTASIDPLGNRTTFTLDNLGRQTQVT